jgi:pterin-4a-carbinolamine dehydratase
MQHRRSKMNLKARMLREVFDLNDDPQVERTQFEFLPPREKIKSPGSPIGAWTGMGWAMSMCKTKLSRRFAFLNKQSRDVFVLDIMDLERTTGHNIDYHVCDYDVSVVLTTKDIDEVTDMDMKCAKHLSDCEEEIKSSAI